MATVVLRRCARCARLLPQGAQTPFLCAVCRLTAAGPGKAGTPNLAEGIAALYASTPPRAPAEVEVPRDLPALEGEHHAPASTPSRKPASSFEVQPRAARTKTSAPTAGVVPFARVARGSAPLPRPPGLPADGASPPPRPSAPAGPMPNPAALPSPSPAPPAQEAPPSPAPPLPPVAADAAAPVLVPQGPRPGAPEAPSAGAAPPPPLEVDPVPPLSPGEVRVQKRAMPVVKPRTMEFLAAVDHGQRPEPGLQTQVFYWDTEGEPPAPAKEGEGAYVVYHSIDIDADVRLAYQTLVMVKAPRRRGGALAGGDHKVVVDDRISVQKRALLDTMDAVRTKADQAARRSRERLARNLARRRARVVRWPRGLAPLGFGVIRVQARLGHGFINAKRGLRRGLVEVPDHLASALLRVQYNLSSPLGRKALVEGLRNPNSMNQDQRSAMVILTVMATAAAVLLLNSVIALATPQYADVYRSMLKDAALQIIGLFGAPIPIEPFFIFSLLTFGAVIAFAGFFVGKMLGAWVLILLGESLHEHLKKTMKGGRSRRLLDWLKVKANRYGFPILVLDNAVPFAPDQLMLVFAVTGMRTRDWMLGIALGTALKLGAMIVAVDYYGPDTIEFFFERPLEYLQGQRPAE